MVILVRRCFDFISVRPDRLDRPSTVPRLVETRAGPGKKLGLRATLPAFVVAPASRETIESCG